MLCKKVFRSGGWGYVLKSNAGIDLLRAVEAARKCRLFVSSGLLGHDDIKQAENTTLQ